MKKDHLAKSTIEVTARRLRLIAKSVNLNNPDEVTEYLANKKGKNGYIDSLVSAFERYTKYNGIFWKKPNVKRYSQPPYVPATEETSILIANAGTKYSLILSILRDTGMRPIEIERTKLKWLDLNRGTINVETAKHGNGRTLKLKHQTLAMLKEYVGKNNFNINDNIFPKVKTMRRFYYNHSSHETIINLSPNAIPDGIPNENPLSSLDVLLIVLVLTVMVICGILVYFSRRKR